MVERFSSRLRARASTALAVLALSTVAVPSFAQSEEERAGARSAAQEGLKAFREQRWPDAIDLFTRAESLVHSPVHVLYLARSHAQVGKLVKARELYVKVSRESLPESSPKAFFTAQTEAQKEQAELEPRLPYVTVQVTGQGAQQVSVTQDGIAIPPALIGVPRPVDPGDHEFQALTETLASKPQKITLAEKARQTLTLKLEPRGAENAAPPPPAPGQAAPGTPGGGAPNGPAMPGGGDQGPVPAETGGGGSKVPAIAAFGVGAVGIGIGLVFLLKAGSAQSDADALYDQHNCGSPAATLPVTQGGTGTCLKGGTIQQQVQSGWDDAKSARTLSTVGFVVGGLGIAGGVVLLILSNKSEQPKPATAAEIRPYIGIGSLGVTGTF